MLDVVEAACGQAPRVLDLAGGTGSISRRVLARFPGAMTVIVDVDPALLAIAEGTFAADDRVSVRRADLDTPAWVDVVGGSGTFDAVLTATALHWLTAERIQGVYAETYALLRPGGVFGNADHMADAGLVELSEAIGRLRETRIAQANAAGQADWEQWWDELAAEPEMAALIAERNQRLAPAATTDHTRSNLASSWHLDALRAAGYAQTGLAWRGLLDALAVGVRG
jgi:SAM-dependent methyltransferase